MCISYFTFECQMQSKTLLRFEAEHPNQTCFGFQQVDVTIHGFKFGNPPGAEAASVSFLDSIGRSPPIPVRAIRLQCLRLVSNHQISKQQTLGNPLHVDLCLLQASVGTIS